MDLCRSAVVRRGLSRQDRCMAKHNVGVPLPAFHRLATDAVVPHARGRPRRLPQHGRGGVHPTRGRGLPDPEGGGGDLRRPGHSGLAAPEAFDQLNALYAEYFRVAPPVRSAPVVQLPRGLLFSIEAIAAAAP